MHSGTVWKSAKRPNYETNMDLVFPYSEVPYLGEYNLVKIPVSLNNLIQHIDYWGEGRVVTGQDTSGFSNCYNVNHQYRLVSRGPDRDRKIPNRIPVLSYSNGDTSAYIKDNSVITVTTAGQIDSSCANDIARMVNSDLGKVVAYGVDRESKEIENLTIELAKKGILWCPAYVLLSELQVSGQFESYVVFGNSSMLKDVLYKNISNGIFDNAENISKSLEFQNSGRVINEIVMNLIRNSPRHVMTYAYKLWHGDAKDIVQDHFPESFHLIFNEDVVTIVNKQYQQALKLNANTDSKNNRLAWGDKSDKTSKSVSWKIISVWDENSVTFKLYNTDGNMYLKLDVDVDNIGDRKVWGSTNSNEDRHRYVLEPLFKDGTLVFFIINCQYNQALKLAYNADKIGDRQLWGHNGAYNKEERFRWIIAAW